MIESSGRPVVRSSGRLSASASIGFVESYPEIVTQAPTGPDDPLGESVLDLSQPWLRVFEPRDVRVVIGRHQDPRRECVVEACQAAGVPIHRRVAGGGTVVLAPGMIVIAARLANTQVGTDCWFGLMNEAIAPAVAEITGVPPQCRGHGDLTVPGAEPTERLKILGASLRQTKSLVIYLGVLLVDDAVPWMERLLPMPSRMPDYRSARGHRAFCTHLSAFGAHVQPLRDAVERHCRTRLAAHAVLP